MQYKVIRTCYFAGRLFERGEVVVFDADTKHVPEHFQAVGQDGVVMKAAEKEPVVKGRRTRKKE